MGNGRLQEAKLCKKDEFYTRMEEVESECGKYADRFRGKSVYCNCDDVCCSNFWRYFHTYFERLGLESLTATHYDLDVPAYMSVYHGGNDGDVMDAERILISGDGDFRSDACVDIAMASDVVVTNPPFSLFRDYLGVLHEAGCDFLIMGCLHTVTYKEFYPLLFEGRMYPGYLFNRTVPFFVPDGYDGIMDPRTGRKTAKVPGTCFYSSFPRDTSGSLGYLSHSYKKHPEQYPSYDNYDAIDVGRVGMIPYDYDGVMGVPVSYFGFHDPDRFEILGYTGGKGWRDITRLNLKKVYENPSQHQGDLVSCGGKINTGCAVLCTERPDGCFYTADNADGYLVKKYGRMLIRRKG